ncbi:MAG: PhzF family phenazine biosynthesis protein [candidate division KSB1 bacterium]|nr:PhzF family phenazine biosynthesis protein [candidate division KSB1 bacterium]MDZ7347166.1 PhzF family phenazine biosynthesis protein [candidate division KSB1 bacterium]
MGINIYQVDAFTKEKFKGNPAVICLLERHADESWMQAFAAEMNFSETAFVLPLEDGFHLRWFTPTTEVDLCGHATLAAAHVLFEIGRLSTGSEAHFHTRSGLLTVRKEGDLYWMKFPSEPPKPTESSPSLTRIFGAPPIYVGRNRHDMLIHMEDPQMVTDFVPDFYELAEFPVRGIILTSRSEDPAYDFISRFFAPRVGINEDPVTGSAHCCLGPYWAQLLGKSSLRAYQASNRGGELLVVVKPDSVLLGGSAVMIFKGELV